MFELHDEKGDMNEFDNQNEQIIKSFCQMEDDAHRQVTVDNGKR